MAEKIAVFDKIIMKANKTGAGGAIRMYFIARSYSQYGKSFIPEFQLDLRGKELGVNPRTWRQWKQDALELRFLVRGSNDNISWMGIHKVANELELNEVGHQFEIFPSLLVRKNWKAYVFAGFQSQFKHPISRKSIKTISGIGISTQRKYDVLAGTKRTSNFETIENPSPDEIEKCSQKSPYFWGSNGKVIRRLPDDRDVSKSIAIPKHFGREKKIRDFLRYERGSLLVVGESNPNKAKAHKTRLFFSSDADFILHSQHRNHWEQKFVFIKKETGKYAKRWL